jgi:RNA polymerase sigma-70 factor (ECF subfamily)
LQKEEPSPALTASLGLGHRNVHRGDLEAAVRSLPANERLLFLLRDVEGYESTAIARLLKMPEAKVQRTCFAARVRLAQILAEQARTEAA